MDPRLKSSKKWTALPGEYLQQIQDVFQENFKQPSKKGRFVAEGRIYPEELLLRVGYLENGRLMQANCETSIAYDKKKDNMVQMIHLGIDCIGSMMNEYFETQGQADFPREWKSFTVEQREVFLRFTTVNTELEAQANKLLGEEDEQLVQGDAGEEEKEAVKQSLGLKSEDDKKSDKS